jgi:arylsulfatase A-like enzyme
MATLTRLALIGARALALTLPLGTCAQSPAHSKADAPLPGVARPAAKPAPAAQPGAKDKPNVLLIVVDDLRDWVGYLDANPQVRTPNIDRLARLGESFTHAYGPAPLCNPSRAAMLSGLRPSTTGVYRNVNDWRMAVKPELTLPTAFQRAGYRVVGAGKVYHEGFQRRSEWDEYYEWSGPEPNKLSPKAPNRGVGGIHFAPLDDADSDFPDWHNVSAGIAELNAKHEQPFFLAVGLRKPHMPWNVPQKYFDMWEIEDIVPPTVPDDDLDDVPPAGIKLAKPDVEHSTMLSKGRWKEAVRGYLATIAYTDMNVGRLLDAWEASPERDNTIVCLVSDHGFNLGEKHHWRKDALWEETTRVPLVIVAPGVTRAGSVCERSVDLLDIYPTLMDLCDLPQPRHLEGESLVPLLKRPDGTRKSPAITTLSPGNHAVRSDDWRYIRYADGSEELYHDAEDPHEWVNVAADPHFAAKKGELARWLPRVDAADIGGIPSPYDEDSETPPAEQRERARK